MAKMNYEVEFTNEMIAEIINKAFSDVDLEKVETISIAKVDGEIIITVTPIESDKESFEVVKTGNKVDVNISLGE